jgi:hypothetical protein
MSGMFLDRLLHDPADAQESPNIGAYLRSSDGTHLTHTTIAAKEALDINIAGSDIDLQVDLDLSSLVADDDVDAGENPLKIGYRSHDQSTALTALSAGGDKSNAISDLYRRQYTTSVPNISLDNGAVTVNTIGTGEAELKVGASKLPGRQEMVIQNKGAKSIFVGKTGVTTVTGIEVTKGSTMVFQVGEAIPLFAVSTVDGQDVRVLEVA